MKNVIRQTIISTDKSFFDMQTGKPLAKYRINNFHNKESGHTEFFIALIIEMNDLRQISRVCTSHYIALHTVENIVLYDLQRVLGMARDNEEEFVAMLQEKNKRITTKELADKKKTCEEAERRIEALDRIIESLYEDKVSGTLSEERFIKMSKKYEQEQAELMENVKALKKELSAVQKETADINKFLRLVKKYTEITELKPEIVRIFIDKIYVHKGEKAQGRHRQTVEIFYNCVGAIPDNKSEQKIIQSKKERFLWL